MFDSGSGVSGASTGNSFSNSSSFSDSSNSDSSFDSSVSGFGGVESLGSGDYSPEHNDSEQVQTSTEQIANEPTTTDRLADRVPAGTSAVAQGMMQSG